MIKIPAARANAAEASLPTLVEDGSVFLRMRRTHARGGSKSAADGKCCWSGGGGCFVDRLVLAGDSVVAEATAVGGGGEVVLVGELMVVAC